MAREADARGPAGLAGHGPRLLQEHLHAGSRRPHRRTGDGRTGVRGGRASRELGRDTQAAAVAGGAAREDHIDITTNQDFPLVTEVLI